MKLCGGQKCNNWKGTSSIGRMATSQSLLHSQTLLPHALNEGDLVDFLQRGHAQPHFVQGRFAQEPHTLLTRCTADFRRWLFNQNHLPDAVAQIEQFMDRSTSAESCSGAF